MPKAAKSEYDLHPGIGMMQKWVDTLREKTGRSLGEWVKFISKEGPETEEERRDWLKKEHKLGTNSAWWLAQRSFGKGDEEDTPEGYLKIAPVYVDRMYTGAKSALRPIHDALVAEGRAVAKDVKICPCETIVPMFRNHVFAQIKPSTRTRIDLGFALGALLKQGKKVPKRLEDTGGFAKKDRITHRMPLSSLDDIDDDVRKWLRKAYELDARE